jgi:hypothetical protein
MQKYYPLRLGVITVQQSQKLVVNNNSFSHFNHLTNELRIELPTTKID